MPFYLETRIYQNRDRHGRQILRHRGNIGRRSFSVFSCWLKLGINRGLLIFGILQALSTAGFAVLARIGYSISMLSGVIAFENLSSGMGTAAFVAFMASITNKRFTATQYALLTSLMGLPRALGSSVTGVMAKNIGWESFFIFCTLIAIPGMLLLLKIAPWNSQSVGEAEEI